MPHHQSRLSPKQTTKKKRKGTKKPSPSTITQLRFHCPARHPHESYGARLKPILPRYICSDAHVWAGLLERAQLNYTQCIYAGLRPTKGLGDDRGGREDGEVASAGAEGGFGYRAQRDLGHSRIKHWPTEQTRHGAVWMHNVSETSVISFRV